MSSNNESRRRQERVHVYNQWLHNNFPRSLSYWEAISELIEAWHTWNNPGTEPRGQRNPHMLEQQLGLDQLSKTYS